jgi:predicted ATP-binding protein involved in virulence
MANNEKPNDAVYFLSLSLENVRCFGSRQTLDLSDGNGRPARWTVILGDNGTGKTTLLQVLAGMKPYLGANTLHLLFNPTIVKSLYRNNNQRSQILANICFIDNLDSNKTTPSAEITYHLFERSRYYHEELWDNYEQSIIKCDAYGATRHSGKTSLSKEFSIDNTRNLFNDQAELINAEEWLLQADYMASKSSEIQAQAKNRLELIRDVLIHLLPDVEDIRVSVPDNNSPNPRAEFKTPDGWLKLSALSLGYQTMIAWMVDLAAHLFQRYPDSPNPISEPAVVLVDEIDLHLHPKWQRTIMSYLSERFVNTQFIVTAHSPLIVQAAESANIAVLKREGDEVHIHQQDHAVRGWRIDQLLTSDLFDLKSSRSPHYENLLEQRRKILSKPKLTKADQTKLKKLEAEIGDLPTAETPEDIQAMDIIRRAAQVLQSKQ